MGFFKDERFEGLENELVVVKGDVAVLEERNGVLEIENAKLVNNYGKLEQKNTENVVKIDKLENKLAEEVIERNGLNKRVEMLENLLAMLKEERSEADRENARNKEVVINGEWLSIDAMSKTLGLSCGTILKYYLAKRGLLVIKANLCQNSFEINYEKVSKLSDSKLNNKIKLNDGDLYLHQDFQEYLKSKLDDIKDNYKEVLRKNKKFKESKKRIAENMVEDYQKEINAICGTLKGYDETKWGKVYDQFRKVCPTLESTYKSYINDNGYITKITYVVGQLGMGDVMLRIACNLYA